MKTNNVIVHFNKFDLDNLVFSKIKDNKINIRYKTNKKNNNLFIQTPSLTIDKNSILNNKLNVQLSNSDFYNFYRNIELYILEYIASNSKKFLGELIELDILEDYFKSNLIYSNSSNIKLKFNFNYINNILSTLIYDHNKKEIDLDECNNILCNNKINNVALLFTIDSISFDSNIFKLNLTAHQIKFLDEITEIKNNLSKYTFLDSESYDNDIIPDDIIDYDAIEELEKKALLKEINKEKEFERLKLIEKKYNYKKNKKQLQKKACQNKISTTTEKNITSPVSKSFNLEEESLDDYINHLKQHIL
tara:strand:- start:62 stop:976 length:915 start_codon:yes stop_codon:yes gene_type:complete